MVAKNCLPGPEMCLLLVHLYKSGPGGIKVSSTPSAQRKCYKMDAMDYFSDKAGDLMEEVYQY